MLKIVAMSVDHGKKMFCNGLGCSRRLLMVFTYNDLRLNVYMSGKNQFSKPSITKTCTRDDPCGPRNSMETTVNNTQCYINVV